MADLKHASKPVLRSSSRPKRPRRSWPISPCALSRIKKTLPKAARASLRFDGASVSLDPSAVDVDVARFERLVADSSPDALGQVAALYRGDLLAGLVLAERPFEEWLTAERQRLHELAIQGLGRLLTHQQKAGRNRREQRRVVPEEMHRDVLAKAQPGDRHAVGTGRTTVSVPVVCDESFFRPVETAIGPAAS